MEPTQRTSVSVARKIDVNRREFYCMCCEFFWIIEPCKTSPLIKKRCWYNVKYALNICLFDAHAHLSYDSKFRDGNYKLSFNFIVSLKLCPYFVFEIPR